MRWLSRLFFPPQPAADALAERGDVLAFLRRRRANCDLMAKDNWFATEARDRARQLDVLIGEIGAGMHEGSALVEATIRARTEGEG